MAVYLVGYDLHQGENYEPLIQAIKNVAANNWWHCLDSTWLIVHGGSAARIRDALIRYLPRQNDRLLVAAMGKYDAAWTLSFPQDCQDWLKTNL